jgi:uncharacterized protein with HEPN domain
MIQKDFFIFLEHILSCIDNILLYTKNMDEEAFLQSRLVQDAVLRNFEVIGEATKKIPENFRSSHVSIPWKSMAGMRDKLIHDYIKVDIEAVWTVVEDILPQLKLELQKIINRAGSPG